jgi:4-hydroxybenzoate polyprenyltransferase
MKTHRLDFVSLVFGIVAVVIGFAAINSRLGNLLNDRPDALVPALLLCVGVAAIAIATRRSLQDVDGASDDQHDRAE